MPFFNNNRLNWPINGDINAWADFLETICIFSEGHSLSIEDFIDFLKDDNSKTTKDLLTAINFNEHFLITTTVSLVIVSSDLLPAKEENDESDENEFDGDDIENEDKEQIQSRLIKLFTFLASRKQYFATFYPFEVNAVNHIRLNADLTDFEKLYLILLFSSEMHLFAPNDRNRIGHLFEALCKFPFEYLLPIKAEKRFFGAGAGEILAANYQGNLHNKLVSLAKDLGILTTRIIEDPDEIGNSGDGGLDWVGWVSFEDNCDHQPVYFGQCACGSNWVSKQHETSLSVWRNYLEINQSVQCFHFMPRSFRRTSLDWFRRTEIVQELTLIDRYRMLKIFATAEQDTLTAVLSLYKVLLDEVLIFEFE